MCVHKTVLEKNEKNNVMSCDVLSCLFMMPTGNEQWTLEMENDFMDDE